MRSPTILNDFILISKLRYVRFLKKLRNANSKFIGGRSVIARFIFMAFLALHVGLIVLGNIDFAWLCTAR